MNKIAAGGYGFIFFGYGSSLFAYSRNCSSIAAAVISHYINRQHAAFAFGYACLIKRIASVEVKIAVSGRFNARVEKCIVCADLNTVSIFY